MTKIGYVKLQKATASNRGLSKACNLGAWPIPQKAGKATGLSVASHARRMGFTLQSLARLRNFRDVFT